MKTDNAFYKFDENNILLEYIKQNSEKLYLDDVTHNFSEFFQSDLDANKYLKENPKAREYVKERFLDFNDIDSQTIANLFLNAQTRLAFNSLKNEIATFVINHLKKIN